MDIAYLRARERISLQNAAAAKSLCERRIHEELAHAYAAEIEYIVSSAHSSDATDPPKRGLSKILAGTASISHIFFRKYYSS